MSLPESYLGGSGAGEESLLQPNTLLPTGMGTATPPMPSLPVAQVQPTPDPWQTVARMLQGFAAGTVGRPNPVIELEQQQQALAQRSEALRNEQAWREANQKLQEQRLDLERRSQDRLEKHDAEGLAAKKTEMAQTLGMKLLDSADPDLRVQGYKMLQQSGLISADADPNKLSLLGKADYNQARDEAITFIENGLDPAGPEHGGRYSFLPLDQYKKTYAANPLSLNTLRSKPQSEDALLKGVVARIAAMDPQAIAANPAYQRQLDAAQAALNQSSKVNYGEKVHAILGSMGFKNPTAAPPEAIAEAVRRSEQEGPPTLDRVVSREQSLIGQMRSLDSKLATASSTEAFQALKDAKEKAGQELKAVREHKEAVIDAQARVVGQKTAAAEAERPFPPAVQNDLDGYQSVLATAKEFRTFSKKELDKYTGILRNPALRAKQAVADVTGLVKVDPRFSQFESLMGRFQQNYFALGGKQLTGFEMAVARLSTPTGREAGGATEMLAKAKYMEAFTRIARENRMALAKVGKGNVDTALLDRMLEDSMRQSGLELPTASNPTPWMPRTPAPAGYKAVR